MPASLWRLRGIPPDASRIAQFYEDIITSMKATTCQLLKENSELKKEIRSLNLRLNEYHWDNLRLSNEFAAFSEKVFRQGTTFLQAVEGIQSRSRTNVEELLPISLCKSVNRCQRKRWNPELFAVDENRQVVNFSENCFSPVNIKNKRLPCESTEAITSVSADEAKNVTSKYETVLHESANHSEETQFATILQSSGIIRRPHEGSVSIENSSTGQKLGENSHSSNSLSDQLEICHSLKIDKREFQINEEPQNKVLSDSETEELQVGKAQCRAQVAKFPSENAHKTLSSSSCHIRQEDSLSPKRKYSLRRAPRNVTYKDPPINMKLRRETAKQIFDPFSYNRQFRPVSKIYQPCK